MSMRLALLCSLCDSSIEKFAVAKTRQYYTDGYRSGVSGTEKCISDSDCEINEVCQSGYCLKSFNS